MKQIPESKRNAVRAMIRAGVPFVKITKAKDVSMQRVKHESTRVNTMSSVVGVCGLIKKTAYYESESDLISVVNGEIVYRFEDLEGDELIMYNKL